MISNFLFRAPIDRIKLGFSLFEFGDFGVGQKFFTAKVTFWSRVPKWGPKITHFRPILPIFDQGHCIPSSAELSRPATMRTFFYSERRYGSTYCCIKMNIFSMSSGHLSRDPLAAPKPPIYTVRGVSTPYGAPKGPTKGPRPGGRLVGHPVRSHGKIYHFCAARCGNESRRDIQQTARG